MAWIYFLVIISTLSGLSYGLDCGAPSKPNHSLYNFTGLSTPGSVVYYSCLQGYKLIGEKTRRCYENGTWLPYQPLCEAENVTCGFPGHNAHARVDSQGHTFLPGSFASYSCDLGYVLVGPIKRVCQQDGKWSLPAPYCAAKVSMHRRVARVSQYVDVHEKPSRQGSAILDDNNLKCSVAEQADKLTSFWKIDLLEPQSVDVIVLIFGDKINVDVTIRVNSPDTFNETTLAMSDFSLSKWTVPAMTRDSSTQYVTAYEFSLGRSWEFQYITVEIKPIQNHPKLNFCELLVLSKTATSFGQCFSERPGSLSPADTTTALLKDTCYSFAHSQSLPWATADVKCKELTKGGLVTDVDINVQQVLRYSLDGVYNGQHIDKNFWIGAITAMTEDKRNMPWIWKNDNKLTQYYWGRLQPDMSPNEPACLSLSGPLDWQWDDKMCTNLLYFVCQHKILQCGTPALPENTLIDHSKLTTDIGSTVSYFCSEGYSLQGYRERTCKEDGRWSGFAPFCFPDGSVLDKQTQKLQTGVIIAIVCGVVIGALLLIALVCFLAARKSKAGTKVMKFNKQSESAETLDVHDKKVGNYSATDVEK